MPMLAFAGLKHWDGTPRWLSDALFTSLYASVVPAQVTGRICPRHAGCLCAIQQYKKQCHLSCSTFSFW